jgi:uncharacterized membrane protein YdjX (TVP38/TMEM64 family)
MEQKTNSIPKIVRNFVIATTIGIFVEIFLAVVVNNMFGGGIPIRTIGDIVGATIGISLILLNRRKAE